MKNMDLENIRSITAKDFAIFRKKKYIIYSTIILPLVASIGFPLILYVAVIKGASIDIIASLIPYLSFFFVILYGLAPAIIDVYSLVGEKVEKSLEPLHATPKSDKEILLGKSLSSFVPILLVIYISVFIYTLLVDLITKSTFGYYILPNSVLLEILLLVIPTTILFSVEGSIIISSKVNDIRTSSQFGIVLMLPFIGVYVLSEAQIIPLNDQVMFAITGVLIIIDVILFFLSSLLFNRDEILTKWK